MIYPSSAYDYGHYSWLNNEEVVYGITLRNQYRGGLMKTHRVKRKFETLADSRIGVRVVNPLVNDKDHAWVWVYDSADPYVPRGLQKIHTGRTESFRNRVGTWIRQPEDETRRWWFDWNDEPRLVECAREEKLVYLHRWNEDDDWKPIELDPERWKVWAFAENNKELIVSGYGIFDTVGLYFFDLETQELSECYFRDKRYDFGATARLAFHRPTGQLLGIS